MEVRARAWCRVDLAGGTLDIWPLGLLHPGACTVNVAVDLPVEVVLREAAAGYRVTQRGVSVEVAGLDELRRRPESALFGQVATHLGLPPVEIGVASASPRGAGLGASSALGMAMLAAGERLMGLADSPVERRASVVRDLEARLMGLPTGRQDHYPAVLGGALEIAYGAGSETVRRLDVDLEELAGSLVLAYTGSSHVSGDTNWQVMRRRLEGEAETTARFDGIAAAAAALGSALEAGEWQRAGELVAAEWSHRRGLAEGVSTPAIESLLAAARQGGAWGGKACGAGGGGCIVVVGSAGRRREIAARLEGEGAEILPARPVAEPLAIEVTG